MGASQETIAAIIQQYSIENGSVETSESRKAQAEVLAAEKTTAEKRKELSKSVADEKKKNEDAQLATFKENQEIAGQVADQFDKEMLDKQKAFKTQSDIIWQSYFTEKKVMQDNAHEALLESFRQEEEAARQLSDAMKLIAFEGSQRMIGALLELTSVMKSENEKRINNEFAAREKSLTAWAKAEKKRLVAAGATADQLQALDETIAAKAEALDNEKVGVIDANNSKIVAMEKKLKIISILVSSAQAIMQGYAQLGPIGGTAWAITMAGITGIQIAAVAKQSYQTDDGEYKMVPGNRGMEVPATLHGGEVVGRPPFGGGGIVVNGDIYGWDEAVERLRNGLYQRQRRTGLAATIGG
jgi:aspartate 1-decarboxylase